jgi:hypothetical protein
MQLLASGSRDGSVQVCDSSSGEIVARLLRPNSMRGLLLDPLCTSTLTYFIVKYIYKLGETCNLGGF